LRYRKLKRIENSFQKFPPYWYYRGQAAKEIGNEEEALRCFGQFQQIDQGILRKDPFAASTAMCKTMLKAEQAVPDEVRKDLEVVLANSDDADWSNILFAALQHARLGDADQAGRLILRNLDNGHDAFIENTAMIRTVGPALLLNAKPEVFNRIMDTVLENDKVKNYDLLWLYGQIRNRDILKRIEPEFDRVMLLTDNKSLLNPLNILRGDNLILYLPTRWIADNLTVTLRLTTESGEDRFGPAEISPLEYFPEITVLTFRDVLSIKKYIKEKRSAQIAIALVREKLSEDRTEKEAYDIEMIFRSTILPSAVQLSKIRKYSFYLFSSDAGDKAKASEKFSAAADEKEKDPNEYALWFAKQKLIVNGEAFQWSDNGVVFVNSAVR
jgi:hypothetical protein